MKRRWTLFWVASDSEEDCFVVARNHRSAARIEIEMNGFIPEYVTAERVCVVPKAVEEAYFSKVEQFHPWPWYVYGREFFEGVGAEFRSIEGKLQMLFDEFVYEIKDFVPCSMHRKYAVGRRAAHELDKLSEFSDSHIDHEDVDYFGTISRFVHEILGRCLIRCQEIENNLASSFIFFVPSKNKPEGMTFDDLRNSWKKLTFGQLVKIIKKEWDMIPEVDMALELFRDSRNMFVHRLCTDPRYDISTKWGVLEFLPFLQFFEIQTKVMLKASKASLAASAALGLSHFGEPDDFDAELFEKESGEDIAIFFEFFRIKD
jgi:hypothetical protein